MALLGAIVFPVKYVLAQEATSEQNDQATTTDDPSDADTQNTDQAPTEEPDIGAVSPVEEPLTEPNAPGEEPTTGTEAPAGETIAGGEAPAEESTDEAGDDLPEPVIESTPEDLAEEETEALVEEGVEEIADVDATVIIDNDPSLPPSENIDPVAVSEEGFVDPQACPPGELPGFMGGGCAGGGIPRAAINAAIADASDGWTVWIEPGLFTENVVIDKRITLRGTGSGSNPASDTIIASANPAQSVIQVTAAGTAAQPITIKDLRVTGAWGGTGNTDSGIHLRNAGVEYVTIDNVASVNNAGRGVAVDTTGDVANITVRNSDLSNNSTGFRIPASANSATGIQIDNTTVNNNAQAGIEVNYHAGETTEITVTNTTLSGNGGVGAPSGGDGGIIVYQYGSPAAPNNVTANFTNVTITGPAVPTTDTSGFYINARTNNTTSGTYNFNNVEVNGNHANDIRFRRSPDLSGVSMNNVRVLGSSTNGIFAVSVSGPAVDLGNTLFSNTHVTGDVVLDGNTYADFDASGATFAGAATLADVQARVVDSPGPGTGIVVVVPPASPTVLAPSPTLALEFGPDCGRNPYKPWSAGEGSYERPFNRWCQAHTGDPDEFLLHDLFYGEAVDLSLNLPQASE
jgi:hypothetical protein